MAPTLWLYELPEVLRTGGWRADDGVLTSATDRPPPEGSQRQTCQLRQPGQDALAGGATLAYATDTYMLLVLSYRFQAISTYRGKPFY